MRCDRSSNFKVIFAIYQKFMRRTKRGKTLATTRGKVPNEYVLSADENNDCAYRI